MQDACRCDSQFLKVVSFTGFVKNNITIDNGFFKSISWLYIDGKEICKYYSSFIIDSNDLSWNVFKTNSCYTKLHVRNCLVRTHTFQLVSNTNTYTLGCPTLHLFLIELHPFNHSCHLFVWGHKKKFSVIDSKLKCGERFSCSTLFTWEKGPK